MTFWLAAGTYLRDLDLKDQTYQMEQEILIAKAQQLHRDRFHKDAYDLLVANLEQGIFKNFVFENHPI